MNYLPRPKTTSQKGETDPGDEDQQGAKSALRKLAEIYPRVEEAERGRRL